MTAYQTNSLITATTGRDDHSRRATGMAMPDGMMMMDMMMCSRHEPGVG